MEMYLHQSKEETHFDSFTTVCPTTKTLDSVCTLEIIVTFGLFVDVFIQIYKYSWTVQAFVLSIAVLQNHQNVCWIYT